MNEILYETEVELSLTGRELYSTVVKMLQDKEIFLALRFLIFFIFNDSRIPFCEYFDDKGIKEFVDFMKGKNKRIKSVTFCELRDPYNKTTYNLY